MASANIKQLARAAQLAQCKQPSAEASFVPAAEYHTPASLTARTQSSSRQQRSSASQGGQQEQAESSSLLQQVRRLEGRLETEIIELRRQQLQTVEIVAGLGKNTEKMESMLQDIGASVREALMEYLREIVAKTVTSSLKSAVEPLEEKQEALKSHVQALEVRLESGMQEIAQRMKVSESAAEQHLHGVQKMLSDVKRETTCRSDALQQANRNIIYPFTIPARLSPRREKPHSVSPESSQVRHNLENSSPPHVQLDTSNSIARMPTSENDAIRGESPSKGSGDISSSVRKSNGIDSYSPSLVQEAFVKKSRSSSPPARESISILGSPLPRGLAEGSNGCCAASLTPRRAKGPSGTSSQLAPDPAEDALRAQGSGSPERSERSFVPQLHGSQSNERRVGQNSSSPEPDGISQVPARNRGNGSFSVPVPAPGTASFIDNPFLSSFAEEGNIVSGGSFNLGLGQRTRTQGPLVARPRNPSPSACSPSAFSGSCSPPVPGPGAGTSSPSAAWQSEVPPSFSPPIPEMRLQGIGPRPGADANFGNTSQRGSRGPSISVAPAAHAYSVLMDSGPSISVAPPANARNVRVSFVPNSGPPISGPGLHEHAFLGSGHVVPGPGYCSAPVPPPQRSNAQF